MATAVDDGNPTWLTPAFLAEAARGTELYYLADTHWNQAGHDLTGHLVAARLAAQ